MNVSFTSESLLQCVLDASQNGILVYQAVRSDKGEIIDLHLMMYNQAFERDVGPQAPQLLTHSFLRKANVFLGVFERYRRVLETSTPDRFELSFIHPEHAYPVWHDVSVVPKGDFLVISYLDITDLKNKEKALLEAEVLQNSFSSSLNGITVFEAVSDEDEQVVDFRVSMINEAGLQMANMKREQVVGYTIREIYPKTKSEGIFPVLLSVYNTGQPYKGEHFYPDYDLWREMSFVPIRGGVMVTYNDITEQKRIERIEQQQSELLRVIVDNTQIGLSLFEPVWDEHHQQIIDFTFTFTNPAKAFQAQLTVKEMIGQRLLTLCADVEKTEFYRNLVEVGQTGNPKRFLFTHVVDGTKGWVDCIMIRLGNGILLSSLDVSESYQHQQQLELVNRELLLSNDNLQQFAYAASHDLQEPLRKIKSFGDLLIHQFSEEVNPTAVDMIRRMQSASERMTVLIRDLLSYSRISTHREPFQAISLSNILNTILDDLALTVERSKAIIHIGKLPTIWGDRSQLRQLFQNLLANALKFQQPMVTPEIWIDSRLIVGAELDQEPLSKIIIESKFADDRPRAYYEIKITDNGIGFEQHYSERIFQVFQRLHSRSLYEGSGVGLAICKKVVDNHRGAITATGEPGKGATFAVYLPLQRQEC